MAINPPFSIIPEMTRMAIRPSPAGVLASSVGKLAQDLSGVYLKKREQDMDAVTTFLKNFDVRPPDPANPSNAPTVQSLLGAMTGGSVPKFVPPDLLSMHATPKFDIQSAARVFPTLVNNQPPGKETPVGDLLEPGAQQGLGIKGGTTVTPNQKGRGGSGSGTNPWPGISSRARAKVQQMISQASADPASANVKNFPILDPNESQKVFVQQIREEAKIAGIPDDEINAKIGELETEHKKQSSAFQQAREEGLAVIKKYPPEKQKAVKETVKKRLRDAFPTMASSVNLDPELR